MDSTEATSTDARAVAPDERTTSRAALVWEPRLLETPAAPEAPQPRALEQGYALIEALGLLDVLEVVEPEPSLGTREGLRAFHTDPYLQSVAALSEGGASRWSAEAYGFDTRESPPYPGMDELARRYVATARTAVRLASGGRFTRVIALSGRQVHARPDRAVAGAIYNDVLIPLIDARVAFERVAFVNLDPEYPSVVADHFAEDPGLLFISLHESGHYLFPGGGEPEGIGRGDGAGFTVNLPLAPGSGDDDLLLALEEIVLPLLARFEPQLTVLLGGVGAHREAPLAHLTAGSRGIERLIERLIEGRERVVYLGGSADDAALAARLWSLVTARLAGRHERLPERLPKRYAERWGAGTIHDPRPTRLPAMYAAFARGRSYEALASAQDALFTRWQLEPTLDRSRRVEIAPPVELVVAAPVAPSIPYPEPTGTRSARPRRSGGGQEGGEGGGQPTRKRRRRRRRGKKRGGSA